jgi:hypothetical protein
MPGRFMPPLRLAGEVVQAAWAARLICLKLNRSESALSRRWRWQVLSIQFTIASSNCARVAHRNRWMRLRCRSARKFHGGVVAARPDAAIGRHKLLCDNAYTNPHVSGTATIGVDNRRDRRTGGNLRKADTASAVFHPRVDGVPDDSVGKDSPWPRA